jgi:adenylate cyclase
MSDVQRPFELSILGEQVKNETIARERFSRLLSPNIAERVMSGQLEVRLGGQRVDECTVFNSDIRGFTAMSENTQPEELVEMMNGYFELMVDTIFKYEDTLDKFMGDGIMALWGAPVVHKDDAIRSVYCALEMSSVLGDFNRMRLDRDQAPLAIGIGIHTGPLVAGYIGSSKALSYTVIGDVFGHLAGRLCGDSLERRFTLRRSCAAAQDYCARAAASWCRRYDRRRTDGRCASRSRQSGHAPRCGTLACAHGARWFVPGRSRRASISSFPRAWFLPGVTF